jgi:hypothetical protein
MNVYLVQCDYSYRFVYAASPRETRQFLYKSKSHRYGTDWKPPHFIERDPEDEGYVPNAPHGDFVGIDGSKDLGLTANTKAQLQGLLARYGEFLPVLVNKVETLYWFHCNHVLDALDSKNSKVRWEKVEVNPRVMEIFDYVMLPQVIGDSLLFRIPQAESGIFCTDTFKNRVKSLGLTGLTFSLKWSDEPASIAYINDRRLRNMNGPSNAVN